MATSIVPANFLELSKEFKTDDEGKGFVSLRGLSRLCGVGVGNWGKGDSKFTPKVDKYLRSYGHDLSQINADESIDRVLASDVIGYYADEERNPVARQSSRDLIIMGMRSSDKSPIQFPIHPRKQQDLKPSEIGFIYAVKLDGCVKVGFSQDVYQRLKAYSTGSYTTEIIYTKSATQSEERQFHKKYNNNQEKYDIKRTADVLRLLHQTFGCNDPIMF
jgi:hypothetical protein